ncbi:MAG: hypothetical protein CVU42_12565 [Chloroflexi bacterium HGW-Chloroflexi-4]|jgi:hypothetical protein|nr:MAG: hypothetical protein CVU42_12565 [Chloroflexi bacterium HGW-Chloroflexi-4]
MKMIIVILALALSVFLIASCVPVEPNEMLPFCKTQYETLINENPDYPQAFIGACVAWLQSEKPTSFISLCGYEPFRQEIEASANIEIGSKHDCILYIKSLEEQQFYQ